MYSTLFLLAIVAGYPLVTNNRQIEPSVSSLWVILSLMSIHSPSIGTPTKDVHQSETMNTLFYTFFMTNPVIAGWDKCLHARLEHMSMSLARGVSRKKNPDSKSQKLNDFSTKTLSYLKYHNT